MPRLMERLEEWLWFAKPHSAPIAPEKIHNHAWIRLVDLYCCASDSTPLRDYAGFSSSPECETHALTKGAAPGKTLCSQHALATSRNPAAASRCSLQTTHPPQTAATTITAAAPSNRDQNAAERRRQARTRPPRKNKRSAPRTKLGRRRALAGRVSCIM